MSAILDESLRLLKGMTDACFKLGGGLTSFALLTRVGVSTLSKYASTDEANHDFYIPVDIAIAADRRAGSPVIIGEAARQLGYRLTPDDGRQRRAITREDGTIITLEVMDVVRALHEAYSDGKVDAADEKVILKELNEAIRAMEGMRDNLVGGA